MSSLLGVAEEKLDEAMKAQSEGDIERSRSLYLEASKLMLKAAKKSDGDLKKIRLRNAEKLKAAAEDLGSVSSRQSPSVEPEKADAGDGEEFLLSERPSVTFDDVAGLDQVKRIVKESFILYEEHKESAQRFGIESGGGLLLYGPPGTGKTLIGRAIAGELDASFLTARSSDIMQRFVGDAEKKVRQLFETARGFDRSVIFIDEVEALTPGRGKSGSSVVPRVVSEFLSQMEGIDTGDEDMLVLGATNLPWQIDDALLRPGRFDDLVYVPPPDAETRHRIFQLKLQDRAVSPEVDMGLLVDLSEGFTGADIEKVCRKAAVKAWRRQMNSGEEQHITQEDLMGFCDEVTPSVDTGKIKRYERWAEEH